MEGRVDEALPGRLVGSHDPSHIRRDTKHHPLRPRCIVWERDDPRGSGEGGYAPAVAPFVGVSSPRKRLKGRILEVEVGDAGHPGEGGALFEVRRVEPRF